MGFGREVPCSTKGGSKLSEGHKPFDFEVAVRKHIQEWRRRQAFINNLLQESEREATNDPVSGIERLFVRFTSMRDSVEGYLFGRYGFEAARLGAQAIRDYLETSERSPSGPKEWADFWTARIHWMALEVAVIRMCDVVEEAPRLDKDCYRAMRKECEQSLMHLFGCLMAAYFLRTSYEKKRLDELVSEKEILGYFAGWVGAQISLGRNQRLAHSLKEVSNSAFARLLQELPATTLIELDNLVREAAQPSELARRVARHLEKGGNQSGYLQRRGKLVEDESSDAPMEEPMLKEFLLKEQVHALRVSAKLSAREDQVLELMLKDYLDREIASRLGVDEGSVKTTKFRMRKKLKQAAGL